MVSVIVRGLVVVVVVVVVELVVRGVGGFRFDEWAEVGAANQRTMRQLFCHKKSPNKL